MTPAPDGAAESVLQPAPGPAVEVRSPLRRALSVVVTVASTAALALVVLVAAVAVVVPLATGSTPLAVLTGSMRPGYPPGTLVVIRPVDPSQIQVGDVVTYQLESGRPGVATHRVVEVGYRADGEVQLVTQGDANNAPDPEPVREVQLVGRLWYAVPYLGHVSTVLTGDRRTLVVSVVAGAFIAYGVWQITSGTLGRSRRDDTASPATEPAPAADASTS